ncbi:hypothetical protein [Herbiconiux flava]|uniref:Uncharacterized protein n=1 Tax=Herbiconiux flava TaxID=881268 RepID=A0A852SM33_9MICO|nr:hypothetical protein [Herbiconiux flava]NYD68927.1 hypothetical protein [Herbiconiux flava]
MTEVVPVVFVLGPPSGFDQHAGDLIHDPEVIVLDFAGKQQHHRRASIRNQPQRW